IGKKEEFVKIASGNVVESIVASCGTGASQKDIEAEFRSCLSVAQEFATPSLRVKTDCAEDELVEPSNIIVFMISYNTAKYIKKHADEFGLRMPADQTKEDDVIRSCTEEFIRRYSGNSAARVSIVKSVSDQILYCTGEIMDITPLRISKFDELGTDNTYYKNYCVAIENGEKFNTDMWNPHIGFDLHKRGYLPYMNVAKEKQCDDQMVKALFYALSTGKILYKDGIGEYKGRYYFAYNGSNIKDPDGKLINNKNIAQLVAWMRNEAELIEDWSAKFDDDIAHQLNQLPSIASDNTSEIVALEGSMTKMPFMRLLTDHLYEDLSESGNKTSRKIKISGGKKENAKVSTVDRVGPTIFEFAYLIKTSEEIGRDCDDAERILSVAYDVFKKICEYRTNPALNPERFIQVYRQQLENVFESVAGSKVVCNAGSGCIGYFNNLVTWINNIGTFTTISTDNPTDEQGNICINCNYDHTKSSGDVTRILNFIKANFKDSIAADESENDDAAASDEETAEVEE
ncbi:MAG: hypothetical protein IJ299_00175, partial [Oscillospiraceae bacterium]|nr:hypothetical protein [Oscillospiraceae bacterium]